MARVLLVEDSPTERTVISKWLMELDHQVFIANDGADGVEKAKTLLPDIILMDIVMPEVSGYEAIRNLKRNEATKIIPVIIISTRTEDTDVVWGMRQGAKAYLKKPFNKEALEFTISKVLSNKE